MHIRDLWRSLVESINKVNGVSTPLGGVSWVSNDSERTIARRVIIFLEDRRALHIRFIPITENDFVGTIRNDHCVESVLSIREFLTEQLGELNQKSPLANDIRKIRDACRIFLDETSFYQENTWTLDASYKDKRYLISNITFNKTLLDLKMAAGKHILSISEKYGIELQSELFYFASPELDKDSMVKRYLSK